MKRAFAIRTGVAGFLMVGMLAGCSDYPSSGFVDTTSVTDRFKIHDIRGNVYGAKEGTTELVDKYQHDSGQLSTYNSDGYLNKTFQAMQSEEPLPELELKFPAIDGLPVLPEELGAEIQKDLQRHIDEVKAELAEEMAKEKESYAELKAYVDGVEEKIAKHNEVVADAEKQLEAARNELNKGVEQFNAALDSPKTKVDKLLTDNGYDALSSRAHPMKSFRYIDFSGRSKPASCPSKSRFIAINLIKEMGQCRYISYESKDKYAPIQGQLKSLVKEGFINLQKAETRLGEKRSWGTKASGLYLALDQAEQNVNDKEREARKKYGHLGTNKHTVSYRKKELNRLQAEIDAYESGERLANELTYDDGRLASFYFSQTVGQKIEDYINGMRDQLVAQIEPTAEMVFDEETEQAEFDGIGGGYEGIGAATVFVTEINSRRVARPLLITQSLVDPKVADADEIVLKTDDGSSERFELSETDEIKWLIIEEIMSNPFVQSEA